MKKSITILAITVFVFGQLMQAQNFNQGVAPIIFEKCTSCHNPNGANSQVPFTTYAEVASFSSSIYNKVSAGLMPPWPPDTTYTKFMRQHQMTLTSTEKNKILTWITNNMPEGPGSAPVCPTFAAANRLSGKADLVVGTGIVASNSNTTNSNPYNCFAIPSGLTEGRWLRAVEIVPGDVKVVHHVVVTVDSTGAAVSDVTGGCNQQPGFGIGGWSSGAAPVVYPSKAPLKVGQYIPAGSSIIIQMHYAPGSDGKLDSTKVRLYFYDKDSTAGIRPVNDQVVLQNWGFSLSGIVNIPANQGVWITANRNGIGAGGVAPGPPSGTDISIIAMNPHSHFVCTKIINYAYKGTDTIPLIRMNNWKYHWQGYYYYPKPVKVPSDYKLQSKHFFDNRSSNPELLTNPNQAVSFGTKTTDEMLFDDIVWMKYQAGDENLDLGAIAAADTIYADGSEPKPYEKAKSVVTALTTSATVNGIESYDIADLLNMYPNPASDNLNIYLAKISEYKARIFNIAGQTVLQSDTFQDKLTVDLKNIPVGLYIMEVSDIRSGNKITKKVIVSK